MNGQQSLNRLFISNPEPFSINRERVWETLSNLPIEKSDWRYDDLRKNFLQNWQKEIFGTPIIYVDTITDAETPSMYYVNSGEGEPSRIELDSSKFTLIDDQSHCVEHELGHAAFLGNSNVPGWLLYLGDKTAKEAGTENALPYERIVMAIVVRRDIIDYHGLPLNAIITDKQLKDYINTKAGVMDFGLKWLLETTGEDRIVALINFKNGYLINEQ